MNHQFIAGANTGEAFRANERFGLGIIVFALIVIPTKSLD